MFGRYLHDVMKPREYKEQILLRALHTNFRSLLNIVSRIRTVVSRLLILSLKAGLTVFTDTP